MTSSTTVTRTPKAPARTPKTSPKTVAKPKAAPVPRSRKRKRPTSDERYAMIQQAAYLRAERRGFVGGSPEQDWLEAEKEVDRMLVGT